jgi:hypothetical protein
MKFFNDCRTIEEIRARYKQLAKQYHPDCGGDTGTMQAINKEYAYASAHAIKDENLSSEETSERIRLSEEYRQVLEKICHLPNILIELVGNWIWVTGNTYPIKAKLKEAGLFFASKKVAWYYRAEEYKTKGGKKTLEQIRRKYGSERISAMRASKEIE